MSTFLTCVLDYSSSTFACTYKRYLRGDMRLTIDKHTIKGETEKKLWDAF